MSRPVWIGHAAFSEASRHAVSIDSLLPPYAGAGRHQDAPQFDAMVTARWLAESSRRGTLPELLPPPGADHCLPGLVPRSGAPPRSSIDPAGMPWPAGIHRPLVPLLPLSRTAWSALRTQLRNTLQYQHLANPLRAEEPSWWRLRCRAVASEPHSRGTGKWAARYHPTGEAR